MPRKRRNESKRPKKTRPKKAPRPSRKSRKRSPAEDERRCVEALINLPALVITGVLKPAQATVIKGTYSTLLQHMRQVQSRGDQPTLDDPTLVELARHDPALLNQLAPFLTDEQIDHLFAASDEEESESESAEDDVQCEEEEEEDEEEGDLEEGWDDDAFSEEAEDE